MAQDSGGYAGYEEQIKSGGNGKAVAPPKAAKAVAKGTKKVRKTRIHGTVKLPCAQSCLEHPIFVGWLNSTIEHTVPA